MVTEMANNLEEQEELKQYTQKVLKKFNDPYAKQKNPNYRVIYCTRTHSQIKEFIDEIKKTEFSKEFRVLHLASKAFYCLKSDVRGCAKSMLREEKCRNYRDKGKCEYYNWPKMYNSKKQVYVN